jgi:hypothetical protein
MGQYLPTPDLTKYNDNGENSSVKFGAVSM